MNAHQREQILSDILNLTVACPHDYSNPPFCPLHEVRKMSFNDRIKWVHMLSDEELEYINSYHQICLHLKSTEA